MPEPNLQKKVLQEPNIAYGSNFLRDDFTVDDTNISGAWPPLQKFQTGHNLNICTTPAILQVDQKTLIKDWPENEDPFTQADLLNNEEDQVQELIFQIRKSLSIRYHESLANRLLTLFNDAKEEDPDSLGIAVGSLRNFYIFSSITYQSKVPNYFINA